MRRFFYSLAAILAIVAFTFFMVPIVTALPKLRDGLSAFITFGLISRLTPIALGLAVIPLCLALAFDMATRDDD